MATAQAVIIDGKKTFIPLENNPVSLTALASKYGANAKLSFHDVLSFTDETLLSFVPRPVLSLIFIAPRKTYRYVRTHSTPPIPDQRAVESRKANGSNGLAHGNTSASDPTWIPQTIGHACGTMSLVHALSNGPARSQVEPSSLLSALLSQMTSLDPDQRAKLLYDSAELETAHMSVAADGDSRAPHPSEDNAQHFITFVKDNDGRLWELEGGVLGPILRGHLAENEDCLSAKALQLCVVPFVEASRITGEMELSCVAVTLDNA